MVASKKAAVKTVVSLNPCYDQKVRNVRKQIKTNTAFQNRDYEQYLRPRDKEKAKHK